MKSQVLKTVLGIALVTVCSVQSMNAQSKGERKEPPSAEEMMKKMDADEDGQLSAEEVKGPLKDSFADIDTDENGFISLEELEKAPKPKGRPSRD
ncbi:conserved hypothetical protein [Formosa agariphila KMM 3901]|uniref:EF-hand domain-containing protein n=1 Tax=Formosa agariphila (strain DSM 15362 / KCTC 12365 / LMG 23005 / KMM 3901 / M-2Alg 35-1) TaxID=1347342 RepID=T2KMN4_FORAG|nr:hypothetical protein [Formosa agariphila]CDF79239.1 conserved hypothetical protein [Formosa agariphila KMM 3901]